ncbi:MAG TPA: response regulator transcription factor [Mycobacteriales bacterium]|jgi:DNA-binding response OmpR family regulator|nr:response regulator transcription factor [Mycobacteriales bacterium]
MKILVVEDDRKIAATVKRGLDAEGFIVEVAFDGDDGLWKAAERQYSLLILDLMLPLRSGFEICRTLRERGNWTPILVLTAKDGDHDHTEALDTGADDYLTKPFSFPVLVAHVRALLRRTSGGAPAPIQVGDLRVDPSRHRCWRGDTEIPLTAREFSVLEYLVRRTGLITRKFEILDGVWEYDFDGDPNIVEVYIGRLRRKIDEPFGRHDIETVRGAGYRLVRDGR